MLAVYGLIVSTRRAFSFSYSLLCKISERGTKANTIFMEGLSFPVAVAEYSEQDIVKLSYLIRPLQRGDISSL